MSPLRACFQLTHKADGDATQMAPKPVESQNVLLRASGRSSCWARKQIRPQRPLFPIAFAGPVFSTFAEKIL